MNLPSKGNYLTLLVGFVLFLFYLLMFSTEILLSKPFQLIESESATLNRKGSLEKKVNFAYETGIIPVYLAIVRLRYGLLSRLEVGMNMNYAWFHEHEEQRVTEAGGTVKLHLWKAKFYNFNMFTFAHYRHAVGDPLIVDIDADEEGLDEDIIQMVSPHSDGGRDVSFGLLARNSFTIYREKLIYMLGAKYTRLGGRDYGDFDDTQKELYTFNITPELHFCNGMLMLAVENRFIYWKERGHYFKVLPQLRWEFLRYWVFEMGVYPGYRSKGLPIYYRSESGCWLK